jgi:hypothetical protein
VRSFEISPDALTRHPLVHCSSAAMDMWALLLNRAYQERTLVTKQVLAPVLDARRRLHADACHAITELIIRKVTRFNPDGRMQPLTADYLGADFWVATSQHQIQC